MSWEKEYDENDEKEEKIIIFFNNMYTINYIDVVFN